MLRFFFCYGASLSGCASCIPSLHHSHIRSMEYLWSTYGVSTRFIVVGALATVFFSILILSRFRLSLPVHQKIIGLKSLDEMA